MTSDYGAAGQTMEQSVLEGQRCWGRQRVEKAKLPCPRGLRAGLETASTRTASEEANGETRGLQGVGGVGQTTDARRGGTNVQCRQESR